MRDDQKDSRGIVSFMVVIIMMLVISLIVIGFTQVVNRSRRDSLDRQLSAQAFYAAESGVNKVRDKIESLVSSGADIPMKTDCGPNGTYAFPDLDGTDVQVTCLLVDPFPKEIRTSASQNNSTIVSINPRDENGTPSPSVRKLIFKWSVASSHINSASPSSCNFSSGYPTAISASCGYGVLRIDLMQYQSQSGTTSFDTMRDKTLSIYATPGTVASPVAVLSTYSKEGIKMSSSCSAASKSCTAELDISSLAGTKQYYARLTTLYRDSPLVVIDGVNTSGGDLYFAGSQVVVDSAARAQDVVRRIRVSIPISGGKNTVSPPAAVMSGETVCKRFTVFGVNDVTSSCP